MELFMSPEYCMAILIRQPVDTFLGDDGKRLSQCFSAMKLTVPLSLGWRVRDEIQESQQTEPGGMAEEGSAPNMLERQYSIQFSLDCVNQKLITGRTPFVFSSLYLHFMKPSGIINMLKVSLVLFVILQQKKKLILSPSGETTGLGEEGGRCRCALAGAMTRASIPWAPCRWNPGRLQGFSSFWQAESLRGRLGSD